MGIVEIVSHESPPIPSSNVGFRIEYFDAVKDFEKNINGFH